MLQIKFISFKLYLLKNYINFLENLLNKLKVCYSKINIPTKTKRLTILKSPHVFKKAREQFEIKIYKKVIIIKKLTHVDYLKNLIINKPKFININIKYLGK